MRILCREGRRRLALSAILRPRGHEFDALSQSSSPAIDVVQEPRKHEVSRMRIHPETGKELRRDVRPQTIVVGTISRTIGVPGWYPDDESDSVHTGADLRPL